MEWQSVSADFESDGALRDIYIRKATLVDWQAVIDALKSEMPALEFRIGSEAAELPCDISELFFRGPNDLTPALYVPMGDTTVNCHFFSDDEVEFDLNPRDMNEELLPLLLDFLTLLGKATNKPVLLTMENMPEAEIMRFEPSSEEVVYVGPAFG